MLKLSILVKWTALKSGYRDRYSYHLRPVILILVHSYPVQSSKNDQMTSGQLTRLSLSFVIINQTL